MNKRTKALLSLALTVCIAFLAIPVLAKEAATQITAVYRNIQLVVDGVLVEPKDANGKPVEPFIYNGTTYLPVRAVASALEKDVAWDGENAVVYLGGEVDKPAKELPLWNRPYLECSNASLIKAYSEYDLGYIEWVRTYAGEEISDGLYFATESVTYPVNMLAKTFKGTYFVVGADSRECVLKIKGANGKVLYKSPVMRNGVTPVTFEVDIENELSIEIVFEMSGRNYLDSVAQYIENPIIISTDY